LDLQDGSFLGGVGVSREVVFDSLLLRPTEAAGKPPSQGFRGGGKEKSAGRGGRRVAGSGQVLEDWRQALGITGEWMEGLGGRWRRSPVGPQQRERTVMQSVEVGRVEVREREMEQVWAF
jgi:hypothetical protein